MRRCQRLPNYWILFSALLLLSEFVIDQSAISAQISENQPVILNRKSQKYLTGRSFRRALSQPFSASWSNVEIRTIIERIRTTQNISIILDRRIDPSLKVKLDIQNLTLEEGLNDLASKIQAQIGVVGSTVFIGPKTEVSNLKTLLVLKRAELLDLTKTNASLKSRQKSLFQRRTFQYQDLDKPSEILKKITDAYQITVKNLNLIPHDLWAHGTLTSVNANEAISLVLIQFNLTYQWNHQESQIEILPIPNSVTLKRLYITRNKSPEVLISQLKEKFPGLEVTLANKKIAVTTSAELHEQIEQFLSPQSVSHKRKSPIQKAVPIKRRKFTLRVKKVPILAIMNKLEQSGIEFVYDNQKLLEAGIDLNQKIDITVKEANAQMFLNSLFDSLKIKYKIEGTEIFLSVK